MDQQESESIFDSGQLQPKPGEDNPKLLIAIGANDRVPLEEIWQESDPLCRYCRRGIQEVPGRPRRVCGCAIRNIMRRRQGQTPSAPAAQVVKGKSGEERARQKLERLNREAAKQREELEGRMMNYDAGVDEALGAMADEAEKLESIIESITNTSSNVARLENDWVDEVVRHDEMRHAYQEGKHRLEQELEQKRAARAQQEQSCNRASGDLDACRARAQKRLDETAGARHRLENLERRIALHTAAHPELFEGDK
jgi:hypothetical protein